MKRISLHWHWRTFEELSRDDLYAILALRQTVFVVEQKCPYLDTDGRDPDALHLLGADDGGVLRAYLRIVAPGRRFAEPSIGRVVTAREVRGKGLGEQAMQEGLRMAALTYPGKAVRISAQQYLVRFYGKLGFRTTGEPYDEDGIPHIEMVWFPAHPDGTS